MTDLRDLYSEKIITDAKDLANSIIKAGLSRSQVRGLASFIHLSSDFSQIIEHIKILSRWDKQGKWANLIPIILDQLNECDSEANKIRSSDLSTDIDIKLTFAKDWINGVCAYVEFLMRKQVQVFLCYARQDEKSVTVIYDKLESNSFEPWMDIRDILPGQNWDNEIQRAIKESDFFVVCLSSNSTNKRGIIQKEIKRAIDIQDEKLESDIYIIPVRLEKCAVPERLLKFQWLDLFNEDGYQRLFKALSKKE